MIYLFEFRPYRRQFKNPFPTSYGTWHCRQGFLIKITSPTGYISFGDISPLPQWGTESFNEAAQYLKNLKGQISKQEIHQIPNSLPCCQFAFSSAQAILDPLKVLNKSLNTATLIDFQTPITDIKKLIQQGYTTFKIKIGSRPIKDEQHDFLNLYHSTNEPINLRLDANGCFSQNDCLSWLELLKDHPIEYLEQPLPRGQEDAMLTLEHRFSTPIALDESISNWADLERYSQYPFKGPLVIKPSTLGFANRIQFWLNAYSRPIVLSSALETPIGIHNCLSLIAPHVTTDCAHGFGIDHLFKSKPISWAQYPLTTKDLHFLWEHLS